MLAGTKVLVFILIYPLKTRKPHVPREEIGHACKEHACREACNEKLGKEGLERLFQEFENILHGNLVFYVEHFHGVFQRCHAEWAGHGDRVNAQI